MKRTGARSGEYPDSMTVDSYIPPLPADEPDRQKAVDRAIGKASTVRKQLQKLVDEAARRFHTPMAALSIIDNQRQWFAATHGFDDPETPRAISFCGRRRRVRARRLVCD
jgi:hypothetical protein